MRYCILPSAVRCGAVHTFGHTRFGYKHPSNIQLLSVVVVSKSSKMAASSHLGSGKINLGSLRDYYRRELLECLDKCNGTKVKLLSSIARR